MTNFSQMGTQFEQGTLPPAIDELYKYGAQVNQPSAIPAVVQTNPSLLSPILDPLLKSSISDPFQWFTKGTMSALSAAERILTEVYDYADGFTNAVTGEMRNAEGVVTKAKGSYANLAKTAALLGAVGGGGLYLSGVKDDIEERPVIARVPAKPKPKPKGKRKGKGNGKSKRL